MVAIPMGFNNPNMPWSELERLLSDQRGKDGRAPGSPSWNSGGDGPAWGRKRQPYQPPEGTRSMGSRVCLLYTSGAADE